MGGIQMKRLIAAASAVILTISCGFSSIVPTEAAAASKSLIYGAESQANAGEVAEFTVSIADNIGFCNCGVVLTYDSELTPLYSKSGTKTIPTCQYGVQSANHFSACSVNLSEHTIGFAVSGCQDITTDCMLFKVYFAVPRDAAIGTEYDVDVDVDMFSDCTQDSYLSSVNAQDGSVMVTGSVFSGLEEDKVQLRCDTAYGSAGSEVEYALDILQNVGFTGGGMRLCYDKALTPVTDANGKLVLENGEALGGMGVDSYVNKEKCFIGLNFTGTQKEILDGELLKVAFKLPSTAMAGQEFPVWLEMDYFETGSHVSLKEYTSVTNGWVAVPKSAAPRYNINMSGDVNVDGSVDISDAIMLSRYITEDPTLVITDQGKKNGDVNGDSRYTGHDVIWVLAIIAQLDWVK